MPEAIKGLIIFATEQIVQSETESKDQEQLTNEFEKIVADETDDNGDDDQSEHAIEPKHFFNRNDGLRKKDRGTQLQATVNREANHKINNAKISTNTPHHNVNGSEGLGGNGCGTQLQAATNENGYENHEAIDNTDRENNNEQTNDNRQAGKLNNQNHLIQLIPNKNQEIQTLNNSKANHLQSPHLQNQDKLKGKLQCPDKGCNQPTTTILEAKQANQSPYPISSQGVQKLEPTPTLLTTSYPSRSGEKRQMQPQLLRTSPKNAPKATRPVQDPRNRNKTSSPKTRRKQSPISSLTYWISWNDQGRKYERREGKDLENSEIDKGNREILDGNGRINSEIFRIMGNNQHEGFHPIRIYPTVERRFEYQQPITLVKDNQKQRDDRRSERIYKVILDEELKENIVIPIKKEKIKWYNQTFMIKKANRKWRMILGAKVLNKQIADFHFKMHDSNEVKQTIRLGV
ncbi:MAG: hypothetical protein EZS28_008888 [Streblomastix strix]|uniref:Uncharacterized protein n=1 Tax=Streblomastix strix TaxID=222440 RepID=A0A5J4WMY1_9EUKA|nr:MAG: hypothetical protein EZS28_008888 [Streblomastix strix]